MSDDQKPSAFALAKAGYELFGEKLTAYSPERYIIAQAMGMLWPYPGDGAMAQMQATGIYPGMIKDIALLLWVLTLKEPSAQTKDEVKMRAWNTSRAMIDPKGATSAAVQWAASLGIMEPQSDKFTEASTLFFDIVQPAEEAKFTAEAQSSEDESPNE